MRPSPYPLDQELGLLYYATDTPGTGGRLRAAPEDFVVHEQEIPIENEGEFLVIRMTKRNWDHHRALREIARRLGISQQRIGFAGTKDKHAVTTQLITISGVTEAQVSALDIRDISLEPVGHRNDQISLGSLQGNTFQIVVSEMGATDAEGQLESVSGAASAGLPNYVGYQRFGITRPVTHRIGELILTGRYEDAVNTFIGWDHENESPETRHARQEYAANHDPARSLHSMPVYLTFERVMLHHLVERPGDYSGALTSIPKKLAALFVSAFQSYFFNHALSARINEGTGLEEPRDGDLLLFSDGKLDTVTPRTVRTAEVHIRRGRCRIAIMMPGRTVSSIPGRQDTHSWELLSERGISPEDFERASRLLRTAYNGAARPVALKTDLKTTVEGSRATISFSLPPGQYATTVCREIMKNDPLFMV